MSAPVGFLWVLLNFKSIILGACPLQQTYRKLTFYPRWMILAYEPARATRISLIGISCLVFSLSAKVKPPQIPEGTKILQAMWRTDHRVSDVEPLSHGPGLRLREDTPFCEEFSCAWPLMSIRVFPGFPNSIWCIGWPDKIAMCRTLVCRYVGCRMIGNGLWIHACLGEKIDWRLQNFAWARFFRGHATPCTSLFPGFQLPAIHFSSTYARHLTHRLSV